MAETTMEPWSFTIVFDEDKAKKRGFGSLCDKGLA